MSDSTQYSFWRTALKDLFASIDKALYSVIAFLYQIFFNVANASIISGETVKAFFSRVQLILGIIVLFKLAITLIGGIVDPDKITNGKSGASKIVTRVVTALIMLVLIVPLNIPEDAIEAGSYESQLNNNGILFGTLYEFQNRILLNNTLAKLILGTNKSTTDFSSSDDVKEAGNNLALVILKSFVTINMAEGQENNEDVSAVNRMCKEDADGDIQVYQSATNINQVLNLASAHCEANYYEFSYLILFSSVAAAFVIIIVLGFTLDVAVRAFKLAFLRLISPIPIISYIDEKTENTFNTWSKAVMSTYIDLFIRLAILYFIIFIIEEFGRSGITMDTSGGMVGALSWVIIIIGLFYFGKEAPKFITESLGIKSGGTGIFSGFGKLVGAVGGTAAVAKGVVSSGIAAGRANKLSNEARGNDNSTVSNVGAGILGGISGMATGVKAMATAKDQKKSTAVNNAVLSRNQAKLEAAKNGASRGGQRQDRWLQLTGRPTRSEANEAMIANNKAFADAYDRIAAKADVIGTSYNDVSYVDSNGNARVITGSAKELKEKWTRMKEAGTYSEGELKTAENAYKALQARTIESHISSGSGLIYEEFKEAQKYASNNPKILDNGHGGTYDLTNANDFKFAKFHAGDLNDSMQYGAGRASYNAAKADADFLKNNKK